MAWTGPTIHSQTADEQLGWTQEQQGQSADAKDARYLPQAELRPSKVQQPGCLRSAGKWVSLCMYIASYVIRYGMT